MKSSKLSIYLVDDDEDDRMIFREAIEEIEATAKVTTFDSCLPFLTILESGGNVLPDMIFLDLNMPLINGEEALAKIKENQIWSGVPVIIYSTSMDLSKVEDLKKKGASFYLKKPSTYDRLKNALKHSLKCAAQGDRGITNTEEFIINNSL